MVTSYNPSDKSDRNNWRSVLAAILLAKAAVATFSIAPFLLGGYVDYVGLSTRQASQILSVEIFSIAIANVCAAIFWIHKVRCRIWAIRLLILLLVANLACIYAGSFTVLLLLRSLVGLSEGSLLALGFGLMSATRRPDRSFGLMFAVSLGVGAINVRILPLYLETAGATGLFINLALYSVAALLLSQWITPHRIIDADQHTPAGSQPAAMAPKSALPLAALIFLLLANYVYFIGQGGVWSFLERWGLQQGFDLTGIASALSLSLLAGVGGGLFAAWLDTRAGRLIPLSSAIIFAIGSILLFRYGDRYLYFVIAACIFNFVNNFGHPYILGLASSIDKSSRLTVLSGALHTGGQATGPFIVGMLVTDTDFVNALWLGIAVFGLTWFILVPVMLVADRTFKREPVTDETA
jgi:predicted MFS family arabinose efflux permease